MTLNTQLENICTINEAKSILGISYQSTLNLILKGEIDAKKIGWGWAIDKSDLLGYRKRKRIIDRRRKRIDKRKGL